MRACKFVYGDGRPFNADDDNPFKYPLEIGAEVSHNGPVGLCHSGLHFSRTEADAIATNSLKFDSERGLIFLEAEVDESDIAETDSNKFVLKSGAKAKIIAFENRNLVGAEGEPTEIKSGLWMLSDSAVVKSMGGSAVVESMGGSAVVESMGGSAVVERMGGSAVVERMGGSAVVESMGDSAVVKRMGGSAVVESMWDSAVVESMGDSAVVKSMWGSVTVITYNGKIEHIIEDSNAFIVDRSEGKPKGYDAAAWAGRIRELVKPEGADA